jgi:hypothetical protein
MIGANTRALVLACTLLVVTGNVAGAGPPRGTQSAEDTHRDEPPRLEPKAIEILKASSDRLAAAKTLSFTAIAYYEHPSRLGPPLVYTTKSDVLLQRPAGLRVITPGDGPPSEFYYDGRTMVAFAPSENLVAVAEAPPTIDAALEAAFRAGGIYFPFTDLIVADPYGEVARDLERAFYIGQSQVVGGTVTDMVAYASGHVFVQTWIGAEDRLPRLVRAVYRDDPSRLRHTIELSNWQLEVEVPVAAFISEQAGAAASISFARPDPPAITGAKPAARSKGAAAAKRP